jgi:arginyl-tRNA synthetase
MGCMSKERIAKVVSEKINVDKKFVFDLIEKPRKASNGVLAIPCFKLCFQLKQPPHIVANTIKDAIDDELKLTYRIISENGYVKFFE